MVKKISEEERQVLENKYMNRGYSEKESRSIVKKIIKGILISPVTALI